MIGTRSLVMRESVTSGAASSMLTPTRRGKAGPTKHSSRTSAKNYLTPPSTLLPVMPSEPLTVGSTFTGIGGADLGFEAAGFKIAWQCELDAWKRSVLAAHWPSIPIYKDIVELADYVAKSGNRFPTEILHEEQQNRRISNSTPDTNSAITQRRFGDVDSVDVLIGGFPCQDLSVAGKRKGFNGERSVLAFEFLRVAESLKPRWLVLENVPGLLSSNKGLDFQRLLSEVVASGYGGLAWRCLDARYFGVPQRRRRIFIVARRAEAGVNPRTASELALRALCESGSGDTTPCIPPWQEAPADVGGGADEGRIVGALSAQGYTQYTDQEFVRAGQLVTDHDVVAFRKSARVRSDDTPETWVDDGIANTLNTFDVGDVRTTHAVVDSAVRRLTPLEFERLMGLPDQFTAPPSIKAPDSRRYAACGDAIVANVAYWIANRINMIEGEA